MTMKYLLLILIVASLGHAYPFNNNNSNELRPWLRTKAKELMKRDLLGDIQTHTYTLDDHLHIDIMREVIEEELTKASAKLVMNFVSRQHEDFLYPGYMKIFQMIEKKALGDAAMFDLAYRIRDDIYKGHVVSLLNMFPIAVWSVVTSPTVCMKNRGYGEYFYAADTDLKYDAERRHVFMWMPHNEAGKQGDWKFQHIEGNKFHIMNARFDEYLYAEDSALNHDAERRRVFTWMPEWKAGNDANVWAVEMDGEDVFIRNVHYDEYIYAVDGAFYDEKRRRVFSWVPKGRDACDGPTYQCRWMLSVC